jgi:hypothetical protein
VYHVLIAKLATQLLADHLSLVGSIPNRRHDVISGLRLDNDIRAPSFWVNILFRFGYTNNFHISKQHCLSASALLHSHSLVRFFTLIADPIWHSRPPCSITKKGAMRRGSFSHLGMYFVCHYPSFWYRNFTAIFISYCFYLDVYFKHHRSF